MAKPTTKPSQAERDANAAYVAETAAAKNSLEGVPNAHQWEEDGECEIVGNDRPQFWNFIKNPKFVGFPTGRFEAPDKSFEALIFQDREGKNWLLPDHKSINDLVEDAKNEGKVYFIEKGEKIALKGGKTFQSYNIKLK